MKKRNRKRKTSCKVFASSSAHNNQPFILYIAYKFFSSVFIEADFPTTFRSPSHHSHQVPTTFRFWLMVSVRLYLAFFLFSISRKLLRSASTANAFHTFIYNQMYFEAHQIKHVLFALGTLSILVSFTMYICYCELCTRKDAKERAGHLNKKKRREKKKIMKMKKRMSKKNWRKIEGK